MVILRIPRVHFRAIRRQLDLGWVSCRCFDSLFTTHQLTGVCCHHVSLETHHPSKHHYGPSTFPHGWVPQQDDAPWHTTKVPRGNENWKRELSSVSFISPRQLWDLCETKVRLWLISPVSQLFLLKNRCRKSQLGLPVSFKGDFIKLSMKFQNVSSVLERNKV